MTPSPEVRSYVLPDGCTSVYVDQPRDLPRPFSCTCRASRIERSDGVTIWTTWITRHLPNCPESALEGGGKHAQK